MATKQDKESPGNGWFPPAGLATDGWSTDDEATATCYCGDVQLLFPTSGPGFRTSFICNCYDCRKITAAFFAANLSIKTSHVTHIRGQDKLKNWGQSKTIKNGATMTNYWCDTCGTLMYRISSAYPDLSILRLGTVDDFRLAETKLKPQVEQFRVGRVCWLGELDVEGLKRTDGDGLARRSTL